MTANTQSQAIVRVVDDDPDVRRSWQFVIEGEGWNVLTYASGLEFLEKDSPFTPGCLVLDVRMPGMSGIELQHEMKLRGDTLPIIFISAHGDIDMAVKTMKDGADDFLSKPVTPERLLDAIEKAVKRDARIRTESAALEQARAAFRRLSAREQEVATGVARGLLNKQIAYELNISEKTVIAHRSSLCKKLGARTAADITRMLMTRRDHGRARTRRRRVSPGIPFPFDSFGFAESGQKESRFDDLCVEAALCFRGPPVLPAREAGPESTGR